MASEPLDEIETRNLIERRRWGDVTKVYTRRIFRARRNKNNHNSATITTLCAGVGAAALNCKYVDKGEEKCTTDSKKSLQTLAAEDVISLQQDSWQEVAAEDIGQEEGGSQHGTLGRDSMAGSLESRESVTSPGTREAVVQPESREALEPRGSRDAKGTVVQLGSREALEPPGSRDGKETVVQPESREALERWKSRDMAVEQTETRDMVVDPMKSREMVPEPRRSREMAVEPPEGREMAVEPPEGRDMAVGPPEGGDMAVGPPEGGDMAVGPPEGGDMAVGPLEGGDMAVGTPEGGDMEVGSPEGRGMAVEPPEGGGDLALEPPQGREHVEPSESRELEGPPQSREQMEPPESRELPMELQESGDLAVVLPESRGLTVELESRKLDVEPLANGYGVTEADGVVRPQLQEETHRVEVQPWPPVVTRVEDRVRINVSGARSRNEIMELRRELETELDQVRNLFKKLEAKELQLTTYNRSILIRNSSSSIGLINGNNNSMISSFGGGADGSLGVYSQLQNMANDFVERRALMRVNSEVGYVGHHETRPFSRSLSVSLVENSHGVGEFVEREKRTPKANQFYRNSEFLLGKDRLPPESNKKFKPNGAGRKHGGEGEHGLSFGFGYDKQQKERMFRSCNSLLQRLMKHKYGWVFNVPVDAKKLGLHDYHDIIKHPMDLGTIKTRLSQNYYKLPKEFAEDVRLVFHNAMTYNPKGQDVHVMAEALLQIFEERWAVIQTEYNPDWRYQMYHDAGLPAPTSRKAPPAQFFTPFRGSAPALPPALVPVPAPAHITIPMTPAPQMRTVDRLGLITTPVDPKLRPSNFTHVGRTPVLKKPKAKDPNKRDMTYEEKQKLSTNLQNLPSEKLDAIVQIIKKRNSSLNQHDDEIEVDIDSVDAETLWELDRFVTNYKKNLSKNKRKAEIALQARAVVAPTIPVMNTTPAVAEPQKESRIGENNAAAPVQVEKQGDNVSRSSSSSSSSSDSGSSSSDSDSDSSSAFGSDAGRSPRT